MFKDQLRNSSGEAILVIDNDGDVKIKDDVVTTVTVKLTVDW